MNIYHSRAFILIFSFITISLFCHAQEGTVYIFDGSIDNDWSIEANWTPNHPGKYLATGDVIVIDAECFANFLHIEIDGWLKVNQSKTLTLRGTELMVSGLMTILGEFNVESGATFSNDGDFNLISPGKVNNRGEISNNSIMVLHGEFINTGSLLNNPFGEIVIAESASFTNEQYLTNNGVLEVISDNFINNLTFENYKDLFVSGTIRNYSEVTNVGYVYIDGLFTNQEGAHFFNHKSIEISSMGSLMNFGITENFDVAQLFNTGIVENNTSGNILNRGMIMTKGNLQFHLKSGSYLENFPGSILTVEQ